MVRKFSKKVKHSLSFVLEAVTVLAVTNDHTVKRSVARLRENSLIFLVKKLCGINYSFMFIHFKKNMKSFEYTNKNRLEN